MQCLGTNLRKQEQDKWATRLLTSSLISPPSLGSSPCLQGPKQLATMSLLCWREKMSEGQVPSPKGYNQHTSQITSYSYWLTQGHMATPRSKGFWEM